MYGTVEKSCLIKSVTKLLLVSVRLNFYLSDLHVKQVVLWLRQCFPVVFNQPQPSAIIHELQSSSSLHLEQPHLLEWQ